MTRRLLAFAATSLAASALAFVPLATQAATTASSSAAVTADVNNVITMTGSPTADFGVFDPQAGANSTVSLAVDSNDLAGYSVTFTSLNTPTGAFTLKNGASTIPYTIKDAGGVAYVDATPGASITSAAPVFTLTVAAAGSNAGIAQGSYADTLTYTVAAL